MSPFRYRDDDSSSTTTVLGVLVGAIAGFAVGVFVADKMGGIGGMKERIRRGRPVESEGPSYIAAEEFEEFDDIEEDDLEDVDMDLEGRVLEAFRNDPILSERAVDIGAIGDGIIELAGWVDTEDESQHAVTLARGVPDVVTVVNRLTVGSEEERYEDAARRVAEGDPALTESHWEGRTVGTGRRRQGRSDEPDRHEDPRVELAERWSSAEEAIKHAAGDTEGLAERRRKKGAAADDVSIDGADRS